PAANEGRSPPLSSADRQSPAGVVQVGVFLMSAPTQAPTLDTILLMHGTFSGPETPFFRDLRPALGTLFPSAQIEPVNWDGGNYLESRYLAELSLMRRLRGLANRRVLVIAHSHGGNAAYRALARHRSRNNVTVLGLCTIGTPFIEL